MRENTGKMKAAGKTRLYKAAFFYQGFKIPVSNGDDPGVYGDVAVSPKAADLFFLKDSKELYLEGHWPPPYFVQENGPPSCQFEQALLAARRSGKTPLLVAEQFAFHEAPKESMPSRPRYFFSDSLMFFSSSTISEAQCPQKWLKNQSRYIKYHTLVKDYPV
jgi:hypothetical protein